MEAISGGDLSFTTLVETMVRGGAEAWGADTSFGEAVIQAKQGRVEHERELRASDSRPLCRWMRRHSTDVSVL